MQKLLFSIIFIGAHICSAQNFELTDTLLKKGDSYTSWKVYFEYDKAQLRDSSYKELLLIRDFLLKNDTLTVEIQVHKQHELSESYGRNITQDRAETIVRFLIENGIDKSRLIPKGYGDSLPIDNEKDGKSKNRRMVVKIL